MAEPGVTGSDHAFKLFRVSSFVRWVSRSHLHVLCVMCVVAAAAAGCERRFVRLGEFEQGPDGQLDGAEDAQVDPTEGQPDGGSMADVGAADAGDVGMDAGEAGMEPRDAGVDAGDAGMGPGDAGTDAGDGAVDPQPLHMLIVDTASDVLDGDVRSAAALSLDPGADGRISLREAMVATNATPNDGGPDRIEFDIPGTPPHVISVGASGLPVVSDPVVIDGGPVSGGTPTVQLDGTGVTAADGLVFDVGSDGSTVQFLSIVRFPGFGLVLRDSVGHTVLGMHIGTLPDGETAAGNAAGGIDVVDSADNTIGTELGANSNTISGNAGGPGVRLTGTGSFGNVLRGNLVGVDRRALTTVPNRHGVVLIHGAHDNQIGGPGFERNVISGNARNGVRLVGSGTDGNRIVGNHIGSDLADSASTAFGNGWAGVRITQGPSGNLVGGPDGGNRIRHNLAAGIAVDTGAPTDNALLGNLIADNAGLAIDLDNDGLPAVNDAGDVDDGPNDGLNYPVFTFAARVDTTVGVEYELDVPAGDYRIEFFVPVADDPSGHGETGFLIHAETVSHTGSGAEPFSTSFAIGGPGMLTATCTEVLAPGAFGSTSELAQNVPVL